MRLMIVLCCVFLPAASLAAPVKHMCSTNKWGPSKCISTDNYAQDVCDAIETFSERHDLDPHFFARLIWQESRFDPNALSPVGAQGIAQFMPGTARLRGLGDPFNPAEALEHSAQYLAEMEERFGNIGLAAVGYNGGETRAEQLLRGQDRLAWETIDYVQIITSLPYQAWLKDMTPTPDLRLSKEKPFGPACLDLAKNQKLVTFQGAKRKRKPWGIQMGYGKTPAQADASFRRLTKACRGMVNGETPDFIFKKSRASRTRGYYMARLGRDSGVKARQDCARFRASGCLCTVYKN